MATDGRFCHSRGGASEDRSERNEWRGASLALSLVSHLPAAWPTSVCCCGRARWWSQAAVDASGRNHVGLSAERALDQTVDQDVGPCPKPNEHEPSSAALSVSTRKGSSRAYHLRDLLSSAWLGGCQLGQRIRRSGNGATTLIPNSAERSPDVDSAAVLGVLGRRVVCSPPARGFVANVGCSVKAAMGVVTVGGEREAPNIAPRAPQLVVQGSRCCCARLH